MKKPLTNSLNDQMQNSIINHIQQKKDLQPQFILYRLSNDGTWSKILIWIDKSYISFWIYNNTKLI